MWLRVMRWLGAIAKSRGFGVGLFNEMLTTVC